MSSRRTSLPLGAGAAVGVAGFVAEYLLLYVLQAGRVRESLEGINALVQFFGGDPIPAWKVVGWLLFNAHNVAFTHPTLVGGRTARNLLAAGNAPAWFYAIPVVVLLAAGVALAYWTDAGDAATGASAGATIALGYVLCAIVGAFVFRVTRGDAAVTPDLVTAVLLAGVAYPLVLGALGGAGYGLVARRRDGAAT